MRTTDRITILASVIALSLTVIGAADAAEITRFNANGSSASANGFDGTTFVDLFVTRNESTGQGTTTNLYFNRQSCDVNGSCSGILGYGTIPNADFTPAGGSSKLNTNLAAVPGYQGFSFNSNGQTPISCGVIAIDWKQFPRQSSSSNGQSTFVSGAFSVMFSGSQSSSQARANGSIFATPIPTDSYGLFGQNKTSQLIINRN